MRVEGGDGCICVMARRNVVHELFTELSFDESTRQTPIYGHIILDSEYTLHGLIHGYNVAILF